MLVVSDATTINGLVRSGLIDILPKLFGQVVIPPAVLRELTRTSTPQIVREFMNARPSWLQVRGPTILEPEGTPGAGEREGIRLAREEKADLFIVDDRGAYRLARSEGIPTTGTIGVLEKAAELQMIEDLKDAFEQLRARAPDFRIKQQILIDALSRVAERRKRAGTKQQPPP